MKLATIPTLDGRTRGVRVHDEQLVDLGAADLGQFLHVPGWEERPAAATEPATQVRGAAYAPIVPRPGKIVCVGLNYRAPILEMSRDLLEFPTLFSKYAETLVGANDDVVVPPETDALDWECELAVFIGAPVRRARGADAERAIAGFAVLNDITCRDWQFRTREWLQGKNWEATTPLGPYLVTPDELPGGVRPALDISTRIDGGPCRRTPPATCSSIPWTRRVRLHDGHPATGRRDRHRHAGRRRPCAHAAAQSPAGTGPHHRHRWPR